MKNIYKALAALIVFVLTACQATPTEAPAVEFFKDQPGRWISVRPPAGWVTKLGSASTNPSVILTNDLEEYQKTGKTVTFIIVPLDDKGSAEDVLRLSVKRMKRVLTAPSSEMLLEQAAGQSYAWIEYEGKSAETDNVLAYYFFAVISANQHNVLVFTTLAANQLTSMRPAYQSTVKGITLH